MNRHLSNLAFVLAAVLPVALPGRVQSRGRVGGVYRDGSGRVRRRDAAFGFGDLRFDKLRPNHIQD